MGKSAVVSLEGLLRPALKRLLKSFKELKKVSFKEALSVEVPDGGVYLIFDAQGDLLYVGYSGRRLRGRILNHTSPSQTFFRNFIAESGFERDAPEPLTETMMETFSVAILTKGPPKDPHHSRDLEHVVQWILRPRYGSFHHPKRGWEPIPYVTSRHPRFEDVMKGE